MSGKTDIKSFLNSTWTPLGNDETNQSVFRERKNLLLKWYEKWTDEQRLIVLQEFLSQSKPSTLKNIAAIIDAKACQENCDFTRKLPRILTLYIFSFLDPRSLCRVAQVCWYWKYLSEANELWAPKCARLGWYSSGPVETTHLGEWKRHFIDNIYYLQIVKPKEDLILTETVQLQTLEKERKLQVQKETLKQSRVQKPSPWRGPSPIPSDTKRHNYLENSSDGHQAFENKSRKSRQNARPSSASHKPFSRPRSGSASGRMSARESSRDRNQKQTLCKSGLNYPSNSTNQISSGREDFQHTHKDHHEEIDAGLVIHQNGDAPPPTNPIGLCTQSVTMPSVKRPGSVLLQNIKQEGRKKNTDLAKENEFVGRPWIVHQSDVDLHYE